MENFCKSRHRVPSRRLAVRSLSEVLVKVPMKFLIIHYRDQHLTLLARADDGMYVGSVKQNMAAFGEDQATATRRIFVDEECALMWLKKTAALAYAKEDENGMGVAEFEDREGDSRIVVPNAGGLQ